MANKVLSRPGKSGMQSLVGEDFYKGFQRMKSASGWEQMQLLVGQEFCTGSQ
jgi:hypothetical protein